MLLAEGDTLTRDDFRRGAGPCGWRWFSSARESIQQLERSLVVQALDRTGWNQTKAATLLGVNRDQIRYRIEKFQLERAKDEPIRS